MRSVDIVAELSAVADAMERQANAELSYALWRFAETSGWRDAEATPFGRHRDSGPLDRSNFDVISDDLRRLFPDDVDIMRMGHWGYGWVDRVVYNIDADGVRDVVEQWERALSDYPVADEQRYAEYEYDDTHHDGECYADDPRQCPCGYPFWDSGTYGIVCPACERVLTETADDREMAEEILQRHTAKRHPDLA